LGKRLFQAGEARIVGDYFGPAFAFGSSGVQIFRAVLALTARAVSVAGFREARLRWSIAESDSRRYWLTLNAECSAAERVVIAEAEKSDGSYALDATRLNPGENSVRLCAESAKGRFLTIAELQLPREEDLPEISLLPPPGVFSAMPAPEIRSAKPLESVLYTTDGSDPRFEDSATAQNGQMLSGRMAFGGNQADVRVIARSRAGVRSAILTGRYVVDRRLTGWHERTLILGYEYVVTIGAVRKFLETGHGASIGFRLGLDSLLNPNGHSMAARNFLLPGILTQARFLSYSQGGYGEAVTSAVAGPEWVIPLSLKRSVFFLLGVAPGVAYLSVSTPSRVNTGIVATGQAHAGFEIYLGNFGLFLHAKYFWCADEIAPLQGWGGSTGVVWRL
jgi:hypothetical protein